MIQIKREVNTNFEPYLFATTYYNKTQRYPEKFKNTSDSEQIDAIYEKVQPLMDEIETSYPEIVKLFELFSPDNLGTTFMMNPYFIHLDTAPPATTIQETIEKHVNNILDSVPDAVIEENMSLYQMVSQFDYEPAIKWQLIQIFEEADRLYPLFIEVLKKVKTFLQPRLKAFDKELELFYETWQAIEQGEGIQHYVKDQFNLDYPLENYVIYPSIIGNFQGVFLDECCYLGLKLNLSRKHEENFKSALHIMKNLGDSTKLEILTILKDQELYGKELATAMNLSSATISYHMQELLNEGIIIVRSDESTNRIYYTTNKENVIKALQLMMKHFC